MLKKTWKLPLPLSMQNIYIQCVLYEMQVSYVGSIFWITLYSISLTNTDVQSKILAHFEWSRYLWLMFGTTTVNELNHQDNWKVCFKKLANLNKDYYFHFVHERIELLINFHEDRFTHLAWSTLQLRCSAKQFSVRINIILNPKKIRGHKWNYLLVCSVSLFRISYRSLTTWMPTLMSSLTTHSCSLSCFSYSGQIEQLIRILMTKPELGFHLSTTLLA